MSLPWFSIGSALVSMVNSLVVKQTMCTCTDTGSSGVHHTRVDVLQREDGGQDHPEKRRQSMGFVSLQELGWKMAQIKFVTELNNFLGILA